MWDGPKDPFSSGSIGSGQNFPFSPAWSPAPPEEMCAGSDAADCTRSVGTWETTKRIDSQFRTTAWDREEDPLPFLALSGDQEGGGEGRYLLGAKFFFCARCPKPLSLSLSLLARSLNPSTPFPLNLRSFPCPSSEKGPMSQLLSPFSCSLSDPSWLPERERAS